MQLIPVIDLLAGRAVHAVGGLRSDYRPVESRLTASADPADLAAAMADACGAAVVYVADLDAIQGTGSNAAVVERVAARVGAVLLDAGLRTAADRDRLPDLRNVVPVWGSETVSGPEALFPSPDPAAFSVDLRGGRLIGPWLMWASAGVAGPDDVAGMAAAGQRRTGARLVILLDLASVGRNEGPAALQHVPAVRAALPTSVRLAVGGGVRGPDDVKRLADAGADAALVATALHTGAL